jgi:hypothetical protein
MLIIFDERQKKDLGFLRDQPIEITQEFCKITLEFIRKGVSNTKIYAGAAKKLGVTPDVIEGVIIALSHMLTEGAKLLVNEVDFMDSLLVLNLPEPICKALCEIHLANRSEVRTLLSNFTLGLPYFRDMDWRLDIELASRSLHKQAKPVFVMKLNTIQNGDVKSQHLQTDYTNLKHIREELEAALEELNEPYVKRVERNV